MKGFIEEITWSAIVWIFLFVIIIIAFIYYIVNVQSPWSSNSLTYAIEFSDRTSRPNMLAESLSHYKIDDRSLLEHLTEAVIVGSLENSGSDIEEYLQDILDNKYRYPSKYATIVLRDEYNILMEIGKSSIPYKSEIPLLYKGKVGYLVVSVL